MLTLLKEEYDGEKTNRKNNLHKTKTKRTDQIKPLDITTS